MKNPNKSSSSNDILQIVAICNNNDCTNTLSINNDHRSINSNDHTDTYDDAPPPYSGAEAPPSYAEIAL